MIIALLKIKPILEKQEAVIEILESVKKMTMLKPGCISCDLFKEYDDGQKVLYVERWRTKEDMHQHIRSNLYLRILNAIELASEPPEISFHEGSKTLGIELIEDIRTEQKKENA